jgi:DNA adenine methylase
MDFLPSEDFGTYWEPFLGSGALFFALGPQKAVLADVNSELISCYQQVKQDPNRVYDNMQKYVPKISKDYYYRTRRLFNNVRGQGEQAARFIFLNRTGFNGIYRVNNSGDYNVPYGFKEPPPFPSRKDLKEASKLLQEASLHNKSYHIVLAYKKLKAKDFIYLDPPYLPHNLETAYFTHYTDGGFDLEDHKKLAKLANGLHKKGCFVMISNSDNKEIRKLYRGLHWRFHKLPVMRFIAANGTRNSVNELIITNYRVGKKG